MTGTPINRLEKRTIGCKVDVRSINISDKKREGWGIVSDTAKVLDVACARYIMDNGVKKMSAEGVSDVRASDHT